MQSMIRVHTFIKYCKIQLEAAETALQNEQPDICCARLADAGDSLLKSLAAALPTVKKDLFILEEKAVAEFAADLASDPADAEEAVYIISSIRKFRDNPPEKNHPNAMDTAQKAHSEAGRAFRIIHSFFT